MATTNVTLTIDNKDLARVSNAALASGPFQATPPGFTNNGASQAATIKTWLSQVVVAAVAQLESSGGAGGGAPPLIT